MKISFTKMQGLGNDFVVLDNRDGSLKGFSGLSKRLCDRRFGIGADQVLVIENSDKADFRMLIYNADGSEVEMCGNGIRCFAKYLWDRGISDRQVLAIDTIAGIIRPEKAGDMVSVDMGEPVLDGRKIPVDLDGPVKDYPLAVGGRTFEITCISMGNPHAVIVIEDLERFEVSFYGPLIERHPLFPNRTNVEFIQPVDRTHLRMRVWERGAGETMACGTGASAAAVAANLKGIADRKVHMLLAGGELIIDWRENGRVFMTGPAVEVFEGTISLP
ncbi:MAG: diaminopimelate epimerase [Thermodesulfovibrionales bacterium]